MAKKVGLEEGLHYNFWCMDWDPVVADLEDPYGGCDMSAGNYCSIANEI